MKTNLFWLGLLLLVALLSRLIPHPANLSPVLAIALIGARTLNPLVSLLSLLSVMIVGDLFIGFDQSQFYVYLGLAFAAWLGYRTRATHQPFALGAVSVAGSSAFFIISNFGHWLTTGMYSKNFLGLAECYIMAVPFFWRSLASDFFFFGAFLIVSKFVLRHGDHSSDLRLHSRPSSANPSRRAHP